MGRLHYETLLHVVREVKLCTVFCQYTSLSQAYLCSRGEHYGIAAVSDLSVAFARSFRSFSSSSTTSMSRG